MGRKHGESSRVARTCWKSPWPNAKGRKARRQEKEAQGPCWKEGPIQQDVCECCGNRRKEEGSQLQRRVSDRPKSNDDHDVGILRERMCGRVVAQYSCFVFRFPLLHPVIFFSFFLVRTSF